MLDLLHLHFILSLRWFLGVLVDLLVCGVPTTSSSRSVNLCRKLRNFSGLSFHSQNLNYDSKLSEGAVVPMFVFINANRI